MDLKLRADQHFKEDLIERLINFGYTKHLDGRQLYELNIAELKEIYRMEVNIEEELQKVPS